MNLGGVVKTLRRSNSLFFRKIRAPIKIKSALPPPPKPKIPPPPKRGILWTWVSPAERTQFFQASIKLAHPFPAPELRTRILRTLKGFFWIFAVAVVFLVRKGPLGTWVGVARWSWGWGWASARRGPPVSSVAGGRGTKFLGRLLPLPQAFSFALVAWFAREPIRTIRANRVIRANRKFEWFVRIGLTRYKNRGFNCEWFARIDSPRESRVANRPCH